MRIYLSTGASGAIYWALQTRDGHSISNGKFRGGEAEAYEAVHELRRALEQSLGTALIIEWSKA